MPLHRRQLLAAPLSGAVLAGLNALSTPLARGASATLGWQTLSPSLALVSGTGSAVVVSHGRDGVALVDGGPAAGAETLLAFIGDRFDTTPALLFNTHCHRDRTGCNATLGASGATIVAHENTKLWLGTAYNSRWEDRTYPPLPAPALPNRTFHYDEQALTHNGPVRYGVLPQAHTDGDIYVFFPEANVVVAGDVVAARGYPLLDHATNGWIGGMINGLNTLLGLVDAQTRVVTGDGAIVDRAHLEAQADMLYAVIDRIGTHYYQGSTFDEFLATAPTAEFDARWGEPALFLATAWESVFWGHIGDARRFRRP